ncbi:MAG: DUF4234 domain-containing protein [Bacteroidales bacterium]|nr:DUF4234 domain-containing protein [Bacteroidales bacterium]
MEEQTEKTNNLKTDRNIWKFILYSILTIGIYPIVVFSQISNELNKNLNDNKKIMEFWKIFLIALSISIILISIGQTNGFIGMIPTLLILGWHEKVYRKIKKELSRRFIEIPTLFNIWILAFPFILGPLVVIISLFAPSFILIYILYITAIVSPFIYCAGLLEAMNRLNSNINQQKISDNQK